MKERKALIGTVCNAVSSTNKYFKSKLHLMQDLCFLLELWEQSDTFLMLHFHQIYVNKVVVNSVVPFCSRRTHLKRKLIQKLPLFAVMSK